MAVSGRCTLAGEAAAAGAGPGIMGCKTHACDALHAALTCRAISKHSEAPGHWYRGPSSYICPMVFERARHTP